MRPKTATALALLALVAAAAGAQESPAMTLDEVLARHFETLGGKDKIAAVETARFHGKTQMGPGMEAPFTLEWKRPDKVRLEFTLQGQTGIQAYDGETAWYVMPFMGKTEPEEMASEEKKGIVEMADLVEGPLFNYEEKGHKVEYLGEEEIEGTPAHKLEVTLKTGDVSRIYLDGDHFLEFKSESKRQVRGQEIEVEISIGDYKEVGGLVFAHSIEQKLKGMPHGQGQTYTIDEIELGVEIADERFAMPEKEAEAATETPG